MSLGGCPLARQAVTGIVGQGDGELHPRSLPRSAFQFALAAGIFQPLAHVWQTIAAIRLPGGVKTPAVVLNAERENRSIELKPDPDLGGGGVFDGIVQRFFAGEIQAVARLGGERQFRQIRRRIQTVADAGQRQVFLRKIFEISDQAFQRVVARVDGPTTSSICSVVTRMRAEMFSICFSRRSVLERFSRKRSLNMMISVSPLPRSSWMSQAMRWRS